MESAVVVWVLVSVIATLVALVGVSEAVSDVRALRSVNGRSSLAYMHLRKQLGRPVIGVSWTLLGIASLLDERVTEWSVGLAVLIAANAILTVNAALDLRFRRRTLADEIERLTAEERHAQLLAQGQETSDKLDANKSWQERTDEHQGVQDGRIDDVEQRK